MFCEFISFERAGYSLVFPASLEVKLADALLRLASPGNLDGILQSHQWPFRSSSHRDELWTLLTQVQTAVFHARDAEASTSKTSPRGAFGSEDLELARFRSSFNAVNKYNPHCSFLKGDASKEIGRSLSSVHSDPTTFTFAIPARKLRSFAVHPSLLVDLNFPSSFFIYPVPPLHFRERLGPYTESIQAPTGSDLFFRMGDRVTHHLAFPVTGGHVGGVKSDMPANLVSVQPLGAQTSRDATKLPIGSGAPGPLRDSGTLHLQVSIKHKVASGRKTTSHVNPGRDSLEGPSTIPHPVAQLEKQIANVTFSKESTKPTIDKRRHIDGQDTQYCSHQRVGFTEGCTPFLAYLNNPENITDPHPAQPARD
ncbi:hypothetical protein B0H14DRAFT_2569316 [Mycena olivaceomarginata]|nr:hypothetical protein B0H14DRAFT_2569316 [Mycena olivaceomarginata]